MSLSLKLISELHPRHLLNLNLQIYVLVNESFDIKMLQSGRNFHFLLFQLLLKNVKFISIISIRIIGNKCRSINLCLVWVSTYIGRKIFCCFGIPDEKNTLRSKRNIQNKKNCSDQNFIILLRYKVRIRISSNMAKKHLWLICLSSIHELGIYPEGDPRSTAWSSYIIVSLLY